MKKILVIEKELLARDLLMKLLKKKPAQLFLVEDGSGALELLKKCSFDVIFSDLKGIEALSRSQRRPLGTPLIYLKEKEESALQNVDAILAKPLEEGDFEKVYGQFASKQPSLFPVIAESSVMRQILKQVEKIAKSHSNIFISGESGTGKEVIATMVHRYSKRADFPFIRVNCAALSDTLIESEFFGHEKGAFTGAHARRVGRFELADKGTLLLDEISEIPGALQAKLLRVVQEQEFERVGAAESIPIDVRLISTSNRNMKETIQKGEFREDLYYRLNVIPLYLPPLRERKEDILPLAEHFLREICQKNQVPVKTLTEKAKAKLFSYKWPGNIRELRNVIEYSIVIDDAEQIQENQIFFGENLICEAASEILAVGMTLKELEKKQILSTLKACNNNRTHAAEKLGISVRTLRNKLKGYFLMSP